MQVWGALCTCSCPLALWSHGSRALALGCESGDSGAQPSRKGQLPCGRAAHLAFQAPFVQQANLGGQIPSSPVQSPAGVSLAAHGAPNPVDGFSILMWALGGAAWTWGPAGGRA